MLKVYCLCLSLFLFLSCATGEVKFKKDEFKGSDIASMKLNISLSFRSEFVREFKNGKPGEAVIYCTINTGTREKALKEQAFIKIDDKIEKINLSNISEQVITNIKTTTTTTAEMDETGFVDFTKTNKSTSVDSNSYKEHTSEIVLTKALEEKILKSSNLTFRFYFGTEESTYIVSPADAVKIKNFLNAVPK
ncbi:MAG TPA: hypothetical protein PK419_00840 [Spirochaetota bacterium]|jgi:hypothetical protein|nr:hypothetical protein [Spirochaetota bacterium]HOH35989.1 hypothetical protein [Spirochaetota bacterium]HPY01804.1 hypothetical protein [Spirochaetota bacterium]HQA51376.1 hypothetical protein [Spirochaetota bacterium]